MLFHSAFVIQVSECSVTGLGGADFGSWQKYQQDQEEFREPGLLETYHLLSAAFSSLQKKNNPGALFPWWLIFIYLGFIYLKFCFLKFFSFIVICE